MSPKAYFHRLLRHYHVAQSMLPASTYAIIRLPEALKPSLLLVNALVGSDVAPTAAQHTQMPSAQQAASLCKHITGCVPPQASKALPYRACACQATDEVVYTIVGWNHKCTTGCACVKETTCLQQSYQRNAWHALALFLCIREKTHPPNPCESKSMQTATHHAIPCIKLGIASLQQYCTGSQNHPSAKP
jgi:hypothetical protein